MKQFDSVFKLLEYRNRKPLADLLRKCRIEFNISNTFGRKARYSHLTRIETYSTIEICDKLRALDKEDKDLIIDCFLEIFPPRENDIEIFDIEYLIDPESPTESKASSANIISEIEAQRNLMISVSTGGPRINLVNEEYKERRQRIRAALSEFSIEDSNPFSDLWAWYGKWSSGDLPTYQSRRDCIRDLYEPLINRLSDPSGIKTGVPLREPTGWSRVDRGIDKMREQLAKSQNEEDFQAVGLFCREVLISLAQAVYNPTLHGVIDGVEPSETDARRMLESYIDSNLSGGTNEAARRHAKASLSLANELLHKRTAKFRDAALCAEAVSSVVNIIAIVSGRRDPH